MNQRKWTWWALAIAISLLNACSRDVGECWTLEEDGQGGGAGGPIVPTGAGGFGDVPPPGQAPQDADPKAGCGNEWSDKPACNRQFIEDRARCRKARTHRCWASQMERLIYCEKNDGKTGFPALDD